MYAYEDILIHLQRILKKINFEIQKRFHFQSGNDYKIGKRIANMDGSEYKRRRIVVEDEEDEEIISNPDDFDENINDPDDEEGEDIMVNWRRYLMSYTEFL